MVSKQIVQGEKDIEVALNQICEQLLSRHPQLDEMVLVGIRTGGVFLAERLKRKIVLKGGVDLPMGIIDITLYRDDWTRLGQTPESRRRRFIFRSKTRMSFSWMMSSSPGGPSGLPSTLY